MRTHRALPFLALALATACATPLQVDTFEAPGSQIAARRTFAWTGGELGTVTEVDPAVVAATDQHIRDAVVAGLVRKGYQQVSDPKSAQMLVSYQVVGSRRYVTTERPRFSAPLPDDVLMSSNPQPPAASEVPRERRVTEGSVIVFADDPASGELVWRGVITTETRSASSEQGIHTAADFATRIIETFPKSSAAP
jgi:hypothetical protein